jgi:hypothetical protein
MPAYFGIGSLLFALLLVQQIAGLRWPWLGALQADDLYKQLTGFALGAFIVHQWYFPLLRIEGQNARATQMAWLHKMAGAMAPLFFLVHAQRLGYAYQLALSGLYFTVFVTGLVNPQTTGIGQPWFRPAWTVVHVAVSTALPFVVGYHVLVTYLYE